MRHARALIVTLSLAAACCSPPPPKPTPKPVTQQPVRVPTTQLPPPMPSENWNDAPQTPGDWRYTTAPGETMAMFGTGGSDPLFILRCNLGARQVGLARAGTAQGQVPMVVRTETSERAMTIAPVSSGQSLLANTVDARDPLLDAMAISRGRIAIEVPGLPTLYMPAWPEITRVVEDCRG